MNCEQANQIDMVEYLRKLGYFPAKIRGSDHWFLSPLRGEKTPSFKINKSKNIWYDHGMGKGGNLINFACAFFHCSVPEALRKIREETPGQISYSSPAASMIDLPENPLKILSVTEPITDMNLLRYLNQRNIDIQVANLYCKEVVYENGRKTYCALGFKNNSGGYELRSGRFKGSSSPKYVSYFDCHAKSIIVFEGFFDFLTYQTIHRNQQLEPANFLVLNSLSFFTRSLLLIEKHDSIHLYLDNDKAGQECTKTLQQRCEKVIDQSGLYQGYKDLNDWWVSSQKQQQKLRLGR
jgi:DNA primase